jgi:hypothetical protein
MKTLNKVGEGVKLLAFLGLTLGAAPALGAEVEAKKAGVEIYADATNKSDVLGKMGDKESLPAGERKGMFWEVTTKDGKKGYVSVLAVTRKADADANLANAIKNVVKDGRQEGDNNNERARSAVMGVRGLREDDDMANAANIRPNLRAVYAMEDANVAKKKVEELGESVFNEIAKKSGAD